MTHFLDSSPAQTAVLHSVHKLGMVTASQLRRLHYDGTPYGSRARCGYHLLRLWKRGYLWRIPTPRPTTTSGFAEYVYTPPPKKRTDGRVTIDEHRIQITEFYVQMVEASRIKRGYGKQELTIGVPIQLRADRTFPPETDVQFQAEGIADRYWKGVLIDTDAYLTYRGEDFFIEVDYTGSEDISDYKRRMNAYVKAVKSTHQDDVFPMVIWACSQWSKQGVIRNAIKSLPVPFRPAFKVLPFKEAISFIIEGSES